MIEARNLVKWYGPTLAIDDLSFSIPKGQIVGFLGPNGAGKSTTIRILAGYLPPTSGDATVAGHNVLDEQAAARAAVGYLPESTPLYPEMRVEEYLHYRGQLFNMPRSERRKRIDIVVDRCGLTDVRRRVISNLSKGNRQRVGLAQALLHDPPVLILDEPAAGLDPTQIGHVRTLIQELGEKHTILLSSHILPEVERTADRVVIIAAGRIVADGSPDELRRKASSEPRITLEAHSTAEHLEPLVKAIAGVATVTCRPAGDWCRAEIETQKGADVAESLGIALQKAGIAVRQLSREHRSLEEFFVQVTDAESLAGTSAA